MNFYTELLNSWGDRTLDFAWSMFWQSSLLIAVLLVVDFALRRRIRPATLHLLWMILLVKLVLPPSLALPFGAAWWFCPVPDSKTATTPPQVILTYGVQVAELPVSAVPAANHVSGYKLSGGAWALIFTTLVSVGLSVWMVLRWRFLRWETTTFTKPPRWLTELLEETRCCSGVRSRVRIELPDRATSPAVCGLWRPVIFVSTPLVEQLTREQLRGILLHELHHVRRGDLWVNCIQTLVQIAYWWHPLLWIANARIRQVREHAVDQAVMLSLKNEAHIYAPTLLQVAKMTLPRPLNALGLVGILESHNTLKSRIEKCFEFRAPEKARLGVGPILCVIAFGAFAVPMGQPPSPNHAPTEILSTNPSEANAAQRVRLLYEADKLEEAEIFAKESLQIFPTNQVLYHYANRILEAMQARTNSETASELQSRIYGFDDAMLARLAADEQVTSTTEDFPDNPNARYATLVYKFLKRTGLKLSPPRSWFFTEGKRMLMVRATPAELRVLDAAVHAITGVKLHIRARFIQVPASFGKTLPAILATNQNAQPQNPPTTPMSGLLTAQQTSGLLNAVGRDPAARILSDSSLTTLSGRQCQMQVVDVLPVVTDINPNALRPPGISSQAEAAGELYITNTLALGPTLDVVPWISVDTHETQLSIKANVTEYRGYSDTPKSPPNTVYVDGKPKAVALPQAIFLRREAEANVVIPSGQSLVLSLLIQESGPTTPRSESGNLLLVLLTPTVITPTGEKEQ